MINVFWQQKEEGEVERESRLGYQLIGAKY
jgi:hypothetical protein